MKPRKAPTFGLLLLALSGCATVDPAADYERAREAVAAATGETDLYQPGAEEAAQARVAELLQDGLTAREAVQVCLLNNRDIQTALFEIGLARADVVQAGLLSNPSLDVLVRFPIDGGQTLTEGGLVHNLVELWHVPARERHAESELTRTVLALAHDAANLAAQAKSAYASALATREAESVAEQNIATARTFLDLTLERQAAGAATEVEVNVARSGLLEEEVLVRLSRYEDFEAKRQLALVLGLAHAPGDIELVDLLVGPPDVPLVLEHLLTRAREHRLDLRTAEQEVDVARRALELERRLFLRSVEAGVSVESSDGDLELGPTVQLQVPIFDQNQAQIAKAEFRVAQAERGLEGLAAMAAQQVRGALARYSLARETVRLYEEELLPLRQASLDLAREAFAEGKTGFLTVLEAQNKLLSARRVHVEHVESLMQSIPDLEAACGLPFPLLVEHDAE